MNWDELRDWVHNQDKPKTEVLESRYYGRGGDPSNHVEFPAEIERRKKLKQEWKDKQSRKGK